MYKETFEFKAKVWRYSFEKTSWHFVSIPTKLTINIDRIFKDQKRGFGSLKVEVRLNETTWKTSIFPDKKTKTYLLPLKAEIRKKEKFSEGDMLKFEVEILV
jgi:hypothetical protein